jgi:hypothetical protein
VGKGPKAAPEPRRGEDGKKPPEPRRGEDGDNPLSPERAKMETNPLSPEGAKMEITPLSPEGAKMDQTFAKIDQFSPSHSNSLKKARLSEIPQGFQKRSVPSIDSHISREKSPAGAS